jgi:NADH:ubiquinone oxidoreductase subunit
MEFLKQLLTWWNGQTIGTRLFTARRGEYVGSDAQGNKYYRAKSAVPDSIAEHRWVIYNGYSEASAIPPGWHGWIHHRTDTPPMGEYRGHEWQKPHEANPTGSALAYRPPGSIVGAARPAAAPPDYQAWKPE